MPSFFDYIRTRTGGMEFIRVLRERRKKRMRMKLESMKVRCCKEGVNHFLPSFLPTFVLIQFSDLIIISASSTPSTSFYIKVPIFLSPLPLPVQTPVWFEPKIIADISY